MNPNQQQTLPDGTIPDKKVLKVMKAIRQIESSGNYEAIGDNGTSAGAFQWNNGKEKLTPGQIPKNFLAHAQEAGVDVQDFTKASQNKVAYSIMKKWKDVDGLDPEEIAAKWNGAKRDANGRLTYIAPEYGEKFRTALFGGQQGVQPEVTPSQPSVQAPAGNYPTPPEVTPFVAAEKPEFEKEKGMGRKAAEFLFPILEDKERTGVQTAADIALSAATLIPGGGAFGLGGKTLMQGGKGILKSILPKLMKPSTVAKGGGLGYGYDVLSNLSEGKTDAEEVLTPGVGTFFGAGAPLVSRAFKGTKIAQKALDEDAMDKAMDIISPNITKKTAKGAIKKGLVGRGGATGGRIEMGTDTRQTKAAESLKDLIKTGALKTTDTVDTKAKVVRAEIANTAELLERQLKETETLPIKREELDDLLNKTKEIFEESPALVGDAGKSAERIYKKFTSFLPSDGDVTPADILKARKKLDVWIQNEGRGSAFNPTLETAISKGLREIRQGANKLMASKAPNVEVAKMFEKQTSLYDALESIAENEYKQVGTSRTGRYFQRHPYQKEAIKGALSTAGAGIVGGGITSAYLGDKLSD